ncbi:MAG: phosphoenolpyruvate carboxykinase [Candidatus Kerfeldbacteria bacterium]
MFNEFKSIAPHIIQPSLEELREMARHHERTTEFGSASYISEIKSRSGKFTSISTDDGMTDEDFALLEEVKKHLATRELIQLDRVVAAKSEKIKARLIIPKEWARIAYGWGTLFWDEGAFDGDPDMLTIDIPDWKERRVLVDPETMTSILCGTDYIGESKKSTLRLAMYHMKKKGGLGLHAGSKRFTARNTQTGKMEDRGAIFFGLSGTGKSTLVCHHCGINEEGESQAILQDDVVLFDKTGAAYGTEDNFYVKTIGVDEESQPLIYKALTDSSAIMENVMVHEDGIVDFNSDKLTANGRAVIYRTKMDYTKPEEVDLKLADRFFFITRNGLMPPIVRLKPAQAAKYFMLGETVETGAGDPDEIGQAKRVVGFNPFIIGAPGEEGNQFYEIIKSLPEIRCYVINTGNIEGSEGVHDISLKETTAHIRDVMRWAIEWEMDEATGFEVPKGADLHRECFAEGEFGKKWEKIEQDRKEYLAQYPALIDEINNA